MFLCAHHKALRLSILARRVCSVSQPLTRQRPAILAVDFDETLTKHCTLASVVAVAQQKHHDRRSDFQWCTDEYMKDVSAYEVKWQATVRDQSSQTAWSQDLLNGYLEGVLPIERASLERLSTHKILAGVSRKEFQIGGSSVELCPGAAACINRVLNDPRWRVWVVSINWSEDFIRGALEAAGVHVASSAFSIHCNNPVFAADTGLSTGKIGPSVVGAKDKVDLLIRAKNYTQQEHGGVPLLVYAGDSLTDLPALILADIGLLFGNSRGVVEWCQRLGIDFGKPRGVEKSRILYKLTSWDTAEHLLQDHIGSDSSPHA
ncbi:hypothetical protein IWW57_001860 [Coemansia sp. S610]|nr:hypothetical protein IWW57_001860 [Coemansia sp. S610]